MTPRPSSGYFASSTATANLGADELAEFSEKIESAMRTNKEGEEF